MFSARQIISWCLLLGILLSFTSCHTICFAWLVSSAACGNENLRSSACANEATPVSSRISIALPTVLRASIRKLLNWFMFAPCYSVNILRFWSFVKTLILLHCLEFINEIKEVQHHLITLLLACGYAECLAVLFLDYI